MQQVSIAKATRSGTGSFMAQMAHPCAKVRQSGFPLDNVLG
jgi:hypothetical protein